jgi:HCOMODA/2-hydroxy-3-carboxy-muconic semialdehyde decarboxylase
MAAKSSALHLKRRSFLSGAISMSVLSLLNSAAGGSGQSNPPTSPRRIPNTEEQRLSDLVIGNHILFDQGVVDGFGHLSVRSINDPTHFFMSQSRAPGLVTHDDIMEFAADSKPVDQRGRQMYGERFIHGEIFRARPDVQAVVHSHATAVIPFSVTGAALRPMVHTAGFLPQDVPVFEIRDAAGEDNGITVGTNALGAALAKVLGQSPVVLMRGHGMAVVGPTVRHAVYRAIYTQVNAQIQMQAMLIGSGKIVYLNPKEAANVDATNEGELMTESARQWNLWVTQAKVNSARLSGASCP